MNQDTICAIATAQGGAIGCIRVSGLDAIEITSRIFTPARKGKKLKDAKPYTLTFGHIHEEENIIDEVLVSLFRAPHSYTGEDSTEIMCHGSSYILQKVLQLLIGNDLSDDGGQACASRRANAAGNLCVRGFYIRVIARIHQNVRTFTANHHIT